MVRRPVTLRNEPDSERSTSTGRGTAGGGVAVSVKDTELLSTTELWVAAMVTTGVPTGRSPVVVVEASLSVTVIEAESAVPIV